MFLIQLSQYFYATNYYGIIWQSIVVVQVVRIVVNQKETLKGVVREQEGTMNFVHPVRLDEITLQLTITAGLALAECSCSFNILDAFLDSFRYTYYELKKRLVHLKND